MIELTCCCISLVLLVLAVVLTNKARKLVERAEKINKGEGNE